jgi:hypothetical protein
MARIASNRSFSSRRIKILDFLDALLLSRWKECTIGLRPGVVSDMVDLHDSGLRSGLLWLLKLLARFGPSTPLASPDGRAFSTSGSNAMVRG